MTPKTPDSLLRRFRLLPLLLAAGVGLSGCLVAQLAQADGGRDALSQAGSESMSSSIGSSAEKSKATEKNDTKSKSLFFDERACAVEKSIGYEE